MPSLMERIRAKHEADMASKRVKHEQIAPSDVSLRGTGLTKREAERSERAYLREEKSAMKSGAATDHAVSAFQEALDEITRMIQEEARKKNIVLDDSQINALRGILRNRFSVLIGAAGTGKTTITKIVMDSLATIVQVIDLRYAHTVSVEMPDGTRKSVREIDTVHNGEKKDEAPAICGAAWTGRASQQFKRVLPEHWQRVISTIHSLLGYAPTFEEVPWQDPVTKRWGSRETMRFRPTFNGACKLPYTVYILDEASMIPIPLFNELIDAMPKNSRILLIGDINQLPPVYGKAVLGYALQKWPVFELTKIHRQAADNTIIANAHRILNGIMPVMTKQFTMIGGDTCPPGASEMQMYIRRVVKKLYDLGRYDPYKDGIIVPFNKGPIGCDALNEHFVMMFNPERKEDGVIVNKRMRIHTGTDLRHFAIGDKIMMTANISGTEITNGMIGIVESLNLNGRYDMARSQMASEEEVNIGDEMAPLDIDMDKFALQLEALEEAKTEKENDQEMDQRQASHVMTIRFENGHSYVASTAGDYRRVQFGYVATCHKWQGGEAPRIIVVVHSANAILLSREWLYTAVTRARQEIFMISNKRGLKQAITRQVVKGANLEEKIRNYVIETESDDAALIDDPENVDRAKYPVLWKAETVL